MTQVKSKMEKKEVVMKGRKETMSNIKRAFLNPSTGKITIPHRFKVHLNSSTEMYRNLQKDDFQTYQTVWKEKDVEDVLANNTFELHVISREHESNCDAVLYADKIIRNAQGAVIFSHGAMMIYEDPYMFNAAAILGICSQLTKNSDVYIRALLPLDTVFHICEFLKEGGRHDIVHSIGDKYPVIAYIANERNRALYFWNPANENKGLSDFISYARNKIKREGKGRGTNKSNIEILIPPIDFDMREEDIA